MGVDGRLFPRLSQYLAGLPQGLDAHPEATTKADFSLILRRQLAPVLAAAKLPEALRQGLLAPWDAGSWIPTTHYAALCALARDQLWTTDEAYFQGMLAVAIEMYSGPIYRTLFAMFGPSMVAMSAAKRWHTLHQGTELIMKKQNKDNVHLQVSYPTNLLNEAAVQSLGAAFCAIAQASRGQAPSFTMPTFSNTSAEVVVRWTY